MVTKPAIMATLLANHGFALSVRIIKKPINPNMKKNVVSPCNVTILKSATGDP